MSYIFWELLLKYSIKVILSAFETIQGSFTLLTSFIDIHCHLLHKTCHKTGSEHNSVKSISHINNSILCISTNASNLHARI